MCFDRLEFSFEISSVGLREFIAMLKNIINEIADVFDIVGIIDHPNVTTTRWT